MFFLAFVFLFVEPRPLFAMSSHTTLKRGLDQVESHLSLSHEFCAEADEERLEFERLRKEEETRHLLEESTMEKHEVCDRSGEVRGIFILKNCWMIDCFLKLQTVFWSKVSPREEVQAVSYFLLRRFLLHPYRYAEVLLESSREAESKSQSRSRARALAGLYRWLGYVIDGGVARLNSSDSKEIFGQLSRIPNTFGYPRSLSEGISSVSTASSETMDKIDPFTEKRIIHFVETFRKNSGQLPTMKDFELHGFERSQIEATVKSGILLSLYVTLTNGTIVKGYKVKL